jgi:hypothetical protein
MDEKKRKDRKVQKRQNKLNYIFFSFLLGLSKADANGPTVEKGAVNLFDGPIELLFRQKMHVRVAPGLARDLVGVEADAGDR